MAGFYDWRTIARAMGPAVQQPPALPTYDAGVPPAPGVPTPGAPAPGAAVPPPVPVQTGKVPLIVGIVAALGVSAAALWYFLTPRGD